MRGVPLETRKAAFPTTLRFSTPKSRPSIGVAAAATMRLTRVLGSAVLLFSLPLLAFTTGECQPATWTPDGYTGTTTFEPLQHTFAAAPKGANIQPGEINCRFWSYTYQSVDQDSCKKLADEWNIDMAFFFVLNPMLAKDCSDIRTWTKYCVAGCKLPALRSLTQRPTLMMGTHLGCSH